LGDKSILEQSISRFIEAGMKDIVVVVGYRRRELIPILQRLGVQIVINELYDETDMLESVKCGLQAMPSDTRGVLLSPADIPLIDPDTIKKLVETGKNTDAFAIIPSNLGRRGHPIFFGRRILNEIQKYHGKDGIHGVLERFTDRIIYIEVPDTDMLLDVNLPQDYERLLELYDVINRR
jgi:CTP:molybdopterin cytidylyltransferase MocA